MRKRVTDRKIGNNFEQLEQDSKHKGQAKKSTRRMPRHWEPKKDVTSCEKPWGNLRYSNIADAWMNT